MYLALVWQCWCTMVVVVVVVIIGNYCAFHSSVLTASAFIISTHQVVEWFGSYPNKKIKTATTVSRCIRVHTDKIGLNSKPVLCTWFEEKKVQRHEIGESLVYQEAIRTDRFQSFSTRGDIGGTLIFVFDYFESQSYDFDILFCSRNDISGILMASALGPYGMA